VGNTRALWPRFLDALRTDSALREHEDPLDTYVETVVNDACAGLSPQWHCSWAHGSRWLAIQRLAQRAGLAYLSPGHLSVHPIFGPWIALRAVIVVDVDGPSGAAPAMATPCEQCSTQCEPAFARAAGPLIAPVNQEAVTPHWRLWVAARDACPVGREHRYDDTQIGYHYTKERAFLQRALAEFP
jgi:methylmalonic aciduria homocystinuria type C protein